MSELDWAAGFFDGEGSSFLARKKDNKRLSLAINQHGRECLDRFKIAVGGLGYIHGPYLVNSQPIRFQYRLYKRDDVETVINLLYPRLSTPKREQIDLCREEESPRRKKRNG